MDIERKIPIRCIFTDDLQEVLIAGWVNHVRNLGGLKFLQLQDRTGIVQIVLRKKSLPPNLFNIDFSEGDILAIRGEVVSNPQAPRGKEILPTEIIVLNKRQREYPISISGKIETNPDKRYDFRFLDLRNRSIALIFEIESSVAYAFQSFFHREGFLQFFSSKIVDSATESGANVFEIGYFGRRAYLAQSPQFYKQMMLIAGFEKVFEIGPVFRAEKFHTTRHLCEYTSIDFEIAFINNQRKVMDTLESAIKYVINHVRTEKEEELKELGVDLPEEKSKWPILSILDVYDIVRSEGKDIEDYSDLDAEAERIIGQYVKDKWNSDFVFVDRYPWAVRPFYTMKDDNDPLLTRSFDLLYKGQELTTGGQREHRIEVLEQQAKEKGIKLEEIESYLSFFRYGAPPHGGSGTGIERMVQKMLNLTNIREARLLPRDPSRLSP